MVAGSFDGPPRGREPRAWVRSLVGVAAVASLGVGGALFYRSYTPEFDYGEHTPDVRRAEAMLAREPCDHDAVVGLLAAIGDAGDSRGVLRRGAAFESACGPFDGVTEMTLRSRMVLGDLDGALADADKLVAAQPLNPYRLVWRADVQRERKQFARAAADFAKALELEPALLDVPVPLADLDEQLGRPCDACAALEVLVVHHPDNAWKMDVVNRIDRVAKAGRCGTSTTPGATVTARPSAAGGPARVDVELAGVAAGSFVVDTGATYVTLGAATAANAHVPYRAAPKVKLHTANGEHEGSLVVLPRVEVGPFVADHVLAVVVDDLGPGVEGLLGMSFLSRFDVHQADGVFTIGAAARKSAPKP
jgi:aspartyl protease family protein